MWFTHMHGGQRPTKSCHLTFWDKVSHALGLWFAGAACPANFRNLPSSASPVLWLQASVNHAQPLPTLGWSNSGVHVRTASTFPMSPISSPMHIPCKGHIAAILALVRYKPRVSKSLRAAQATVKACFYPTPPNTHTYSKATTVSTKIYFQYS